MNPAVIKMTPKMAKMIFTTEGKEVNIPIRATSKHKIPITGYAPVGKLCVPAGRVIPTKSRNFFTIHLRPVGSMP